MSSLSVLFLDTLQSLIILARSFSLYSTARADLGQTPPRSLSWTLPRGTAASAITSRQCSPFHNVVYVICAPIKHSGFSRGPGCSLWPVWILMILTELTERCLIITQLVDKGITFLRLNIKSLIFPKLPHSCLFVNNLTFSFQNRKTLCNAHMVWRNQTVYIGHPRNPCKKRPALAWPVSVPSQGARRWPVGWGATHINIIIAQ